MGIQINGQTDTISASDGSLVVSGAELPAVININASGIITATSFSGDGSGLTGIDATQIVTGNTSVQTVDTGSDGHVKISTEGVERVRIDSSGRLAVGTAAPDAKLHLSGGAEDVALRISSSNGNAIFGVRNSAYGALSVGDQYIYNNGDNITLMAEDPSAVIKFASGGSSERARLDSSGRLLLGTTTARSNVDFYGTALTPSFQYEGTSHDTSTLSLIANSTTDNVSGQLRFAKSGADGVGNNGAVVNNEVLGRVNFSGNDGTNFKSAAEIICTVEGTVASGQVPAMLRFYTNNIGNSSPNEKFRIQEDGAVIAGQNGQWGAGSKSFYIDNTSDQQTLRISNGDPGSSPYQLIGFYRNRGSTPIATITTNGSTVAYNTSSDYRLKENVVDLDGAITRVKQLAPKRFNFIADETDTPIDGFLAHEVQEIVPEAITGAKDEVEVWKEGETLPAGVLVGDNKLDEDGNTIPKYQGIDQSKLVPLLTAALQEAIGEIESLKTRVAALEAQ